MNKYILGMDDVRVVVDEDGNVKLFKVKNEKDSDNIDEIFKLENDFEQLIDELVVKKNELQNKLINFIFGIIVDLIVVSGTIIMLKVGVPLLVVVYVMGLIGLLKVCSFGTILGNVIKRKKLKLVIKDIQLKLEENKEKINQLRKNSSLQEVDVLEKKEDSSYKYAFHFEPKQGINRDEEQYRQSNVSRGYALRLERKSLDKLLRDNK